MHSAKKPEIALYGATFSSVCLLVALLPPEDLGNQSQYVLPEGQCPQVAAADRLLKNHS